MEEKISISKEEFTSKAMDAILKDEKLGKNGLLTITGVLIVGVIANALFDNNEEA